MANTVTVKNYQDNANGTTTNYLSDGSQSTVRYNRLSDGSLQPYEVNQNAKVSPITTPIDGSKIGQVSPITNIPTAQPIDTGNLAMANNAVFGEIKTTATAPDPSTTEKAGLKNQLSSLWNKISGQAQDESNIRNEYQVAEKKKKALGISNELDLLDKNFKDQVKQIRQNAQGKFGGAVEQDINNAQIQYEDRRANIALAYKVANEDYQGAEELVNQKVDALQRQNAQAMQVFNLQKDMVYNNLTESEKIQANEQSRIRQERAKTVEDTYANMLKFAALNKAPSSVLSAIDQAAKDPNATAASITAAAGKYGVDTASALDMQYKRAQISNIYSEIAKRNSESKPSSVVTPPIVNPTTGKIDPSNQLATVLANPKVKDNTKLQDINGVIAATQQFAERNASGKFPAISLGGVGGSRLEMLAGPQGQANLSGIEAINLKVQQWASGAALTEKQTKQVEKITPKVGDTNAQIRNKTNALANFMMNQAKGILTSQGIQYQPEEVDFFKPIVTAPDGQQIQIID